MNALSDFAVKVLGILALIAGAIFTVKKAKHDGKTEARLEMKAESNEHAVEEMKIEKQISNDVAGSSDDELIERMRARARKGK